MILSLVAWRKFSRSCPHDKLPAILKTVITVVAFCKTQET